MYRHENLVQHRGKGKETIADRTTTEGEVNTTSLELEPLYHPPSFNQNADRIVITQHCCSVCVRDKLLDGGAPVNIY